MKKFTLILTTLFIALPLMAQNSNVYMTQDKNNSPVVVKSMDDFGKLLSKQGKDGYLTPNLYPMGNDKYIFWFTPQNWQFEREGASFSYGTGDELFTVSILLAEKESDKIKAVNELGDDFTLLSQTPLTIDNKQLILLQYSDPEDKALSIDVYTLSYNGIGIIVNADYPVNQISKNTKIIQDIIRSVGTLIISDKAVKAKTQADKSALGEVQISEPDVKDMVTVEFPAGKRLFTTQVSAQTEITPEKNRIYFDCGREEDCRLYLQKMPEAVEETFLSKQNKFYKGKIKKISDSSTTYGRLKVRTVKNTIEGQTLYNYFFTNGGKFVLVLKTNKADERHAIQTARAILENARLKDNIQTKK